MVERYEFFMPGTRVWGEIWVDSVTKVVSATSVHKTPKRRGFIPDVTLTELCMELGIDNVEGLPIP